MKKHYQVLICILITMVISQGLTAQQLVSGETKRYIVIENSDEYFKEANGQIEIRDFLVYNIPDGESSKPYHIEINELTNVIKFGISSKAETVSNTRRCTLIMNSINYIDTYRKVLSKLGVEVIFLSGERLHVDEFYQMSIDN